MRKVSIAFCALVFRTNPGFMLAGVVFVLFIAFSLQTKHSPYMSPSQRELVLADHAIKAESGDHNHVLIRTNIEHVKTQVDRKNKAQSSARTKMRFSDMGIKTNSKKRSDDRVVKYFFDHNTVERFLLFCAILICLAGVMFESDRFKDGNKKTGELRYAWQRDFVTVIVCFIVLLSLIYIWTVVCNEIFGWTPFCIHSCRKEQKENSILSAAKTIQQQKDDHIEMSVINPSMINGMDTQERALFEQEINNQKKKTELIQNEKNALLLERRKLKGMVAAQKRNEAMHMKRGKNKKNKKKDFASIVLENNSESDKQLSKVSSFRRHVSDDGFTYFVNEETNESVWNVPDDAVVL